MENNGGKGFILTTMFYMNQNDTTILVLEKWNLVGKSAVNPEEIAIKQQEKTTTKQQVMWKMHVNKVHTNIGYPV